MPLRIVPTTHSGPAACPALRRHFTSRTTLTASLARPAEEQFPELANTSVTTEARVFSEPGNKRLSLLSA
ncbi:hypothetical protein GA0115234_100323 [Streptomyces sp. DvalAA-43]|nr:hypothetical protein GA0115234_100323 [Streptomyces sp. DvalAA-43]